MPIVQERLLRVAVGDTVSLVGLDRQLARRSRALLSETSGYVPTESSFSRPSIRYFRRHRREPPGLRRVDALRDGAQKDALRLLLFLGGQRPTQLLRVTPADVDLKAGTITLYDGKGPRREPRRHVLPLVKQAAEILERRLKSADAGIPLFSTDDRTTMRHETLSVIVGEISAEMLKAKQVREGFELRDLRRTAETMLASLKVPSDVRAQLLSHGLGGVQNRHYDHHDYALEKKQALERWARHLTTLIAGEKATGVRLRERKKLVVPERDL